MIFDTDIFIWAQRGNNKAARIIDTTDSRYLSVQSYMELFLSAFNLPGFDDLTISSESNNVTIDLSEHGGGTILLVGFDIANLDATDFLL